MIHTDLHIHSRYSNDGELEIKEIVSLAHLADINVLSITDHNIVGGTAEALEHCRKWNISFVPGIN